MSEPLVKIRRFDRGMVDSYGRGKEPEGSFQIIQNIVPTKTGSAETTHGYSTTGGLAALPSGFRNGGNNSTGDLSMNNILADIFPFSTNVPTSYDGRVYFFDDSAGGNRVLLDTWFKDSTTPVASPNSGFVLLDEQKTFEAVASDITISGASTHSIVVERGSSDHGLIPTTDYYKGWLIEWHNSGATEYGYITAYGVSGTTVTFTILDDIGTANLNWAASGANIFFLVRRWFHKGLMAPTFEIPGQCFESEGRVRGSGGYTNLDVNKYPWISQYIDRTFFSGVTGGSIRYQGTYVDEMEIRSPKSDGYLQWSTTGIDAAKKFTNAGTFEVGFSYEYDGYIEGAIGADGFKVTVDAVDDYIVLRYDIPFSRISKRLTGFNVYLREFVAGIPGEFFFIKRIDIVNVPSAQMTMWAFSNTFSPVYGVFEMNGATAASTAAQISGTEWDNREDTYFSRTGRTEQSLTDREIVVWLYTAAVNGRRFFANFYDPNISNTLKENIRFTSIDSNGNPLYDVIPNEGDFYEKLITAGGASQAIQGLIEDGGNLIVFKPHSVHSFYIGPVPEAWVKTDISLVDGLVGVYSLCKSPEGILFADTAQIKLLRNGRVISVTPNIENTYYGLIKDQIHIWYDLIDKSINFADGNPDSIYFYKAFPELAYVREDNRFTYPWYKIIPKKRIYWQSVEADGGIIVSEGDNPSLVYKFHKTDYTFAGTTIYPYIVTNSIVPDETLDFLLEKVVVLKDGTADTGTLDASISIEGTSMSFTSQTKTFKRLFLEPPITFNRLGKDFIFTYNINASPESRSNGKMRIDGIDLYGTPLKQYNQSA